MAFQHFRKPTYDIVHMKKKTAFEGFEQNYLDSCHTSHCSGDFGRKERQNLHMHADMQFHIGKMSLPYVFWCQFSRNIQLSCE